MNIVPLPYAIPDELIVDAIPQKIRVFSEVIPGGAANYSYKAGQEAAYHQQYRESRFAYTNRKGGWDCLRHYEILAAGCIPVFDGLKACPKNTMVTFPKELVLEAAATLLPWDDSKVELYDSYVHRLLDHCRRHCSVSACTQRFLAGLAVRPTRILMVRCHEGENYTRELLSIGLRRLYGSSFVDYPKLDVLYNTCDLSKKYGNGFTYGGRLEDIQIDRERIDERIRAREFDLIIYGKTGRDELCPSLPLLSAVQAGGYSREQIAFLYGGDGCQALRNLGSGYTQHLLAHATLGTCFVRELD
jgi:hypothetical protein